MLNINIRKQINKLNFIYVLGYIVLYYVVVWGKVSFLKVLVDVLVDLQLKIVYGERVREIALRYN